MTDEQLKITRTRILTETAKIIAAGGYAAFSMRRLAGALGLTAGALYRYFPTKQHVLIAYWSDALNDLRCRLARICDVESDPRDIILRILIAYAEFSLEDRDRFRLLFLENDMGQFSDLAEDPIVLAPYHLVRERVADAIGMNILRPLPPDTATRILWGAVHGVVTLAITVKELDFSDIQDLVRQAAEAAVRGLSVAPGDA
ncbi:MAG TPA: TetR/AcrR family transcriptional regulator [Telmatospirillum sp.]|nr:TetR/AcrR family transcriptional regulator [Telmatospirillum sp.]